MAIVRPMLAILVLSTLAAGCGDDVSSPEPQATDAASGAGGSGATTAATTGGAGGGASAASGGGGPGSGGDGAGAGAGGATGGSGGTTAAECFADMAGPVAGPDYDQFGPVIGSHCHGTNHQDITGVEKVVFLGDSITAGTPPTLPNQYYREVLKGMLEQSFGPLDVADCSAWGARTDDLLLGKQEIDQCFPGVEPKRTLVVMT